MNFAKTPVGACLSPLGFVPLMSIRRVGRTGEQRSVDDDNDSFFIRVNDDQQYPLGWAPAGITASGRVVRDDATRAAILGCVARYCTDIRS
jgi:uncharacterized protein YbdZ (MbtH family)